MGNLLRSDLYRLRKGAAVRSTFLGALFLILLFAFIFWVSAAVDGSEVEIITSGSIGVGVLDTSSAALKANGGTFARELLSQNITGFLLLPLFIAVFVDDFSCGAYRNLLSYETNRKKIYLAKLLLSFSLTLALMLFTVVSAFLVGSVAFGLSGFTAAFAWQLLIGLLLQAPLYFALVAIGHCIAAFTRKQGATIAIYFVWLLVYSSVIQLVAMLLPSLQWVALLDFLSGISYLAYYTTVDIGTILFYIGFGLLAGIVATLAGLKKYIKADMN